MDVTRRDFVKASAIAAAMAAALVRGWSGWLLAPFALTMWTLWQLRVAAALLGLAVTAVLDERWEGHSGYRRSR